MAKVDSKVPVKAKNPTRQKIVVVQGRAMGSPIVPFKVLHTETAVDATTAKERVKELLVEYKDTDALSVNYFSL